MARILKTDPDNPQMEDLEFGAEIIRNGGLVVFPTETVYGLGANAKSADACKKIFIAKERPSDNPLIVHISSLKMLDEVVSHVPENIRPVLEMIWPGPVTLLFPKNNLIPDVVTGGSDLVAVRMPDNKLALGLIETSGVPIAAPSANVSTRPSITASRHAIVELVDKVDLIYDSGNTSYGLESTIIDVSGLKPVLLRSGSKSVEDLRSIFGPIEVTDFARGLAESPVPRAPGMKYRHYAPRKKLILASERQLAEAASKNPEFSGKLAIIGSSEICSNSSIKCLSLGSESDLGEVGRNLFSSFRELEEIVEVAGLVMPFTENGMGLAVMNRIRKASASTVESIEELEKLIFQ